MDLNLLRVFDALMRTGSVTAAAERLHLSTPATSRALARLRIAMGDDILAPAGRGLVATPFALRTAPSVRRILEDVEGLRGGSDVEDPRRWSRRIVIRINDALVPILAPPVLARARAEAPGLELRFVTEGDEDVEALRDGSIDLDVGAVVPSAPDVHQQHLAVDRYVALRSLASSAGERLSLDAFCALPQVAASRRGAPSGPIDAALAAVGRSRRIAATVPTLTAAALLALQDEVLVPVPGLLAAYLIRSGLPVRAIPLPVDVPDLVIGQQWHGRLDRDAPSRWLRDVVRTVFAPADRERRDEA